MLMDYRKTTANLDQQTSYGRQRVSVGVNECGVDDPVDGRKMAGFATPPVPHDLYRDAFYPLRGDLNGITFSS